jgi:hypothetical protein
VLGIGVQLSKGAITPTPTDPIAYCAQVLHGNCNWDLLSDDNVITQMAASANSTSAGMAIIGCVVIAIGAVCPLILFRLLAFVEPSTASGASLRQSWSDAGGMAGIARGGKAPGGAAALRLGADGRSGGEASAEGAAGGRLATAMGKAGAVAGVVGGGIRVATSIGQRAADIGSDIIGSAGVGSPGYSMTPTDERVNRRRQVSVASARPGRAADPPPDGRGAGPDATPQAPAPRPVTPPTPPAPNGARPPGRTNGSGT